MVGAKINIPAENIRESLSYTIQTCKLPKPMAEPMAEVLWVGRFAQGNIS